MVSNTEFRGVSAGIQSKLRFRAFGVWILFAVVQSKLKFKGSLVWKRSEFSYPNSGLSAGFRVSWNAVLNYGWLPTGFWPRSNGGGSPIRHLG